MAVEEMSDSRGAGIRDAGPVPEHVMPKVLLIEDDQETAREIRAELIERGFDVDWAATGIEGLDKARAGQADAMIVDRLLPGIPAALRTCSNGNRIVAAEMPDRVGKSKNDQPQTEQHK